MKRKLNKLKSIVLVLSLLTVSLIGCGNTTSPAVGEDVVVNDTEESTEASTEIVERSSAEAAEVAGEAEPAETEIPDGDVAGSDKPVETTPSPTQAPEPTPPPTAEPTPTPEQHVHQYTTETVTRQATCAECL